MSTMSSETPILRRYMLLELLAARKAKAEGRLDHVNALVMYAQLRGIRLVDRGDNWRQHKCRSKRYQGLLGDLFDEFKEFHSKTLREV